MAAPVDATWCEKAGRNPVKPGDVARDEIGTLGTAEIVSKL